MSSQDNLIDLSLDGVKAEDSSVLEKNSVDSPEDTKLDQNNFKLNAGDVKLYSRLCGYLNKLGNRKILNTFRKRWFVFCESNCKLYYYRSPHDQVPLGEIDISQATFSFEVSNKERSGLFTISVPGRDYYLEANNRQTCLFWLQELQKYRRAHSTYRTKYIAEKSSINDVTGRPQSGLLAEVPDFSSTYPGKEDDTSLMLPVDCPVDTIGDNSARNSTNPLTTAQQYFNSFYNQVKSSASFGKYDKPSFISNLNAPAVLAQDVLSAEEPEGSSKMTHSHSGQQQKNSKHQSALKKLSNSFRKAAAEEKTMDSKEHCTNCDALENKLEKLNFEVTNLEEEVATSREVLTLLQRQLDIASKEKDTLVQIYQLKDKEELLKLISEKEQQIVILTHNSQEQKQEIEKLQRSIESLTKDVSVLHKNNELFQEMLQQKDKTIMALTNEVFDLETEKLDEKRRSSSEGGKQTTPLPVEPKETMTYDDLKDAVQAFELQNKFLNNELLELNQLRRDAEERVHLLSLKCSEWEARSYQIQSKLLFLLNELQRTGDQKLNRDVITQLLQEAMGDSSSDMDISSWSREKMYDELGFNWRWGKGNLLSLKATNLKHKSEDIASKANDTELLSWRARWDNFMVALGSKELQRSTELKSLVRMGIPHEYRGRIWKECSLMWIKEYKLLFQTNYYQSLLSDAYSSVFDPSVKQIELDLLRTLPNNVHYEKLDSDGVPKLRRVLLAFSRHDPSVGYCQGLNRLAAIALLFMEEEDAFWCLIAIAKKIMPEGYYNKTLIGSHVDQKVLKDLIAEKLPRLHTHLEENSVDLSLFTFNWFFTVFVDNIPVETYLRIWDVFLYEGNKILFRYALAILKLYEQEILQLKDYLAINKCLRNISDNVIDAKKLTNIAFNELNPFPLKTIKAKRAQHYPIIQAQIEELVSIRKTLTPPRPQEKNTSVDYLSEED